MKSLVATLALMGTASQALAHGSGHLHPHGTEVMPILVALSVAGAAYFLLRQR